MTALDFRKYIEEEGKIVAAKRIDPKCESIEQADAIIWTYIQRLFDAQQLAAAGVVLWGDTIFNPWPYAVRLVWNAINRYPKVLIQGGSSVSKSYTIMARNLLRWQADPEYTTIKLVSTTGGHTKAQTYSTLVDLHRKAIVPLHGTVHAESIGLTENDKRACISIVRIKEGEDNSGALQGFHPIPRQKPHPIYGPTSVVIATLDEAEEIPNGVWTGVRNMGDSLDPKWNNVQIQCAYNPKDITARTAQLAEPVGGWGEFDIETGVKGKEEWKSRDGWHVVRVDPGKTENVKKRSVLYPGFHTFEAYEEKRLKDGGNSLHYFTFGRGMYPPDSAVNTVVPQRVMNLMRGEMIFTGKPIKIGAADIAIDGRDEAVFGAGRVGRAIGIRRSNGETIRFPQERQAAQLDQIFILPKGSTSIVAAAIKRNCISLGIAPEWMMIDATGNGAPVLGLLQVPDYWSAQVRGIDFSQHATETKILEEDLNTPEELYEGIHTEVWFAVSRWGEFGYLCISPTVRSEELERQLIGRRYILGAGKKTRVEKKDDYKKRLGKSPDFADTFTIFCHCARTGGMGVMASITGRTDQQEPQEEAGHGIVDRVKWMADDQII